MAPRHQIPEAYLHELKYAEPLDDRNEEDILAAASIYQPVVSEKNIWAFWDKGLASLPDWCKRNIVDWSRICGPAWTIRVLDTVPDSSNNSLQYVPVDSGLLPEAFVKGTMDGPHVGPHSADLLRGACIYLHGGVWMDVGNILIRSLDRICWSQLSDPLTPYQVCVPWAYAEAMGNHFVAARKGDPFIKRWQELFVHLWRDRTNCKGLLQHPLLRFMFEMDHSESNARGFAWEISATPEEIFEYVSQILAWRRVCMLEATGEDSFNGIDYQRQHILWFDVLEEDWAAEKLIGYDGQRLFDLLSTSLNSDPESERFKAAYQVTWRLLSRSSLQKVIHGKSMMKKPALGTLWEMPDNAHAHAAPGTFAELLRWGSTHLIQKRESVSFIEKVNPQTTLHKGLLEP